MKKWSLRVIGVLWLAMAWPAFSAGDRDGFYEIKNDSQKMLSILEALPYVSEGTGPVMFIFEYSECPYSQGRYRDYKVESSGLQFRHVFVPVSDRSAKESAAMGKSRSIQDYHAFMTGRKQAPVFNQDSAAIDAYNSVVDTINEFETILKKNGWPLKGVRFPQFTWVENGKVFTSAGYEKTDFGRAVARAQKGRGTAKEWARLTAGTINTTAQAKEQTIMPRSSSGIEIVGIELGMTRGELLSAIRTHNPRLNLMEHSSDITVQDSYKRPFKVASYVAEIQAFWDQRSKGYQRSDPKESISVVFAGPPNEHRVESIEREITYVDRNTYPNFDSLVQALIQKYGPTDFVENKGQVSRMLWQLDGQKLTELQLRQAGGSALLRNNPMSTRYHLYPVIDESLPANVLSISGDGKSISYGNRRFFEAGRFLAVQITRQGAGVYFLRTVLEDSMMKIGRARGVTRQMANDALARHELQMKAATQQRLGPSL